MARIEVLVVDPESRRVYQKTVGDGNRVLERVVGGKHAPCYVWDFYPGHAVSSCERSTGRRWRITGADGQISEVFRGAGVLYKVLASERASHALRISEVRDSIDWIEDEKSS